jgi:hypothetical protein
MDDPDQDVIADQITRLARGCTDPLTVAALDLAAATRRDAAPAQRESLAHLLTLAGERLLPEADRVGRAALAAGAGALHHNGLLLEASVRLLIQYRALSTADLLETTGMRLELEAVTSGADWVAQVAGRVQAASVYYQEQERARENGMGQ